MGIYLNPGNENFKSYLKAPIYVDKTMMIAVMNSYIERDNKYICISRPRRFGKTIASEMLCAYYSKGCEWLNAISSEPEYETTDHIIRASKDLLRETLAGNSEAVARALDESHIHVTSNRSYNNEDALQSAIYLAYIYALNKYTVIKEMTTGKGFADVVFIPFVPDIPAMIIELKHNKSAESALDQIKEKKYFDSLADYKGGLLFVGVSYDEKAKTHECRVESFEK